MYKKLKKIFGITIIVLVVVIIALYFFLNSIVSTAIKTIGTKVTGTKVELQSINISPFSGIVEFKGLCIANPKDYHSDNAFILGSFYMNLNLNSIFTDKVIIDNIIIKDIMVNYEPSVSKGSSNLQDIKDNMSSYFSDGKKAEPISSGETKKSGKKMVVKYFGIKNGTISISSSLLKNSLNVSMPTIEMRDVGAEDNKSVGSIINEIYDQMLQGVVSTATGIKELNLDTESLKDISKTSENLGKDVKDSIKSIQSSIGL